MNAAADLVQRALSFPPELAERRLTSFSEPSAFRRNSPTVFAPPNARLRSPAPPC